MKFTLTEKLGEDSLIDPIPLHVFCTQTILLSILAPGEIPFLSYHQL